MVQRSPAALVWVPPAIGLNLPPKLFPISPTSTLAVHIDDAIATEIELVVTGTTEELQGSKPLASLAPGGSTLTLDLVRGDIANGRF